MKRQGGSDGGERAVLAVDYRLEITLPGSYLWQHSSWDMPKSERAVLQTEPAPSTARRAPPTDHVREGSLHPHVRVLHVIESLRSGGAESVIGLLAKHADRTRFEPEAVALAAGGPAEQLIRSEGTTVHILGKRPGIDLRAAGKLRALVRDRRISIIHAHNPIANHWSILACLFMREAPPIINTEHSVHYRGKVRGWYPVARSLLGVRNAAIVGVCEAVTESNRRIDPLNRRRYRTIYNGIEPLVRPTAERRDQIRRGLGVPAGATVIGTVGNLRRAKAYPDFLDAIARLAPRHPGLIVLIAGDGPLRAELEARSASLGLGQYLRWLGRRNDVVEILPAMDVFVLSSRREGFPMAILEAMSAGVPVVATDVGGVREVVRDGETGILLPAGDPVRLSEGIHRMIEDQPAAARMAVRASEVFQRAFTVERMTRSMESLYLEVLEQQGRAVPDERGAAR